MRVGGWCAHFFGAWCSDAVLPGRVFLIRVQRCWVNDTEFSNLFVDIDAYLNKIVFSIRLKLVVVGTNLVGNRLRRNIIRFR